MSVARSRLRWEGMSAASFGTLRSTVHKARMMSQPDVIDALSEENGA
jgi:hypothetical protein